MGEIPPPYALCYLQAAHMPYAPGLCPSILSCPSCPSCRSRCPSAPPRRSTGPRVGPLPEPGQHGPFWASHVAHLPLPLPIARTPAAWTVLPHTALPRTAAPEARDDGLLRVGARLGGGHWGIKGPEGPSGDGAKAGPPTRELVVASPRPATGRRTCRGPEDLKKRRHPCLEPPLADQHHRTISVVPFLPSCRPSRRRALPTVIPPRPSPAFDATPTPATCPSTT